MAENYIVINGKRAELTEEQLKQLGIEVPKASPFARVAKGKTFYDIDGMGQVHGVTESGAKDGLGAMYFNVANYCTNKEMMEQRALHETLNRLLWRYSMEHEGDKIDWNNVDFNRFVINYAHDDKYFVVDSWYVYQQLGAVYFHTKEAAKAAIKEIVEPFMKAHPEFKW